MKSLDPFPQSAKATAPVSHGINSSEDKENLARAAQIAKAYVRGNVIGPDLVPNLLEKAFHALSSPGHDAGRLLPSKAEIAASIRPGFLISFENGKRYKTLRHHLTNQGMTPLQYRRKWGLPFDYPMVSASYSKRRSTIAKQTGRRKTKA